MARLTTEQELKVARLLIHFTNRTNSEILGRFDRATRNRIRDAMSGLREGNFAESNESLQEFADFLYFEPDSAAKTSGTRDSRAISDEPEELSFVDVVQIDDESLDLLLQAAPAELTLDVLCCSPSHFVNRVIERLLPIDAEMVRQRLSGPSTIEYAKVQQTHKEFCQVAKQVLNGRNLTSNQLDTKGTHHE